MALRLVCWIAVLGWLVVLCKYASTMSGIHGLALQPVCAQWWDHTEAHKWPKEHVT